MRKVMVFDDLDNTVPARFTRPFAVDGDAYLIDLSEENAAAFDEALRPFVEVATKLGKWKAPGLDRLAQSRLPVATASRKPPTPPVQVNGARSQRLPHPSEKGEAYRQRVRDWLKSKGRTNLPPRLSRAMYEEYEAHCQEVGIEP